MSNATMRHNLTLFVKFTKNWASQAGPDGYKSKFHVQFYKLQFVAEHGNRHC